MKLAKPGASPIKNIVIIVKENHTFDNYFGAFGGDANGDKVAAAPNPPPYDPDHTHQAWMARANDDRYKVQYGKTDIPGYFDLAQRFTLCDQYFSEVAGPSTPNHLMLICADAPIINNPHNMYRPTPADVYTLPSLPIALEKKGLTWGNYGGYAFHYVAALANHQANHTRDLFLHDAQKGTLPTVSWVYGDGRPDLSEHPPQNVTDGMQWTLEQVQALAAGGLWDSVAIFITWDDWGGWFDHVVPPVKESWASTKAQRPTDAFPEFNGQPFRFGSRVPCLVVSPYAKAGHVSHQENSHVSILKFCETVLGLDALTERDAASNGMSDCFDFSQSPLQKP
ncbi:MAG TPA: alkaline phosphatase family protein [Spirochaetia bacterium]|nr:alkaline phosphatase family protein [Spirochaetia bacterium]